MLLFFSMPESLRIIRGVNQEASGNGQQNQPDGLNGDHQGNTPAPALNGETLVGGGSALRPHRIGPGGLPPHVPAVNEIGRVLVDSTSGEVLSQGEHKGKLVHRVDY